MLNPVYNPKDVPEGLKDEKHIELWETHEATEEFLAKVEETSEEERPRHRTGPINVCFDTFTIDRLKALAVRRSVGYQTLLKEFVAERLYEEKKREGLLSAGQQGEARTRTEDAENRVETTKRDWQEESYKLVKEYEEVFEERISTRSLVRVLFTIQQAYY